MESKATSSLETGSLAEKLAKTTSETREDATEISNTHQPPLDFDPNDPDNPRNFSQKKKMAIAFFILLTAFMA